MSDAFLFDLMHGVHSSKNSQNSSSVIETQKKDRFEQELEQEIKKQVDAQLALENPADHKLLSLSLRHKELEQEIHDASSLTEFGKYFSLAVNILLNEGEKHLENEENATLQKSLGELIQHIDNIDFELSDTILQDALKMDSNIGPYILKIGIDKYKKGNMNESLAIFLFLTLVNPDEPDYWFRFGLIAKKCENYPLALSAFATTSELAPDFIGSHIYSAHCHLKMHSKEEAMVELAGAKKILEITKIQDKWQEQITNIENLLAKAN